MLRGVRGRRRAARRARRPAHHQARSRLARGAHDRGRASMRRGLWRECTRRGRAQRHRPTAPTDGTDRPRLERLVRYVRLHRSTERLKQHDGGRMKYRFKKAWKDLRRYRVRLPRSTLTPDSINCMSIDHERERHLGFLIRRTDVEALGSIALSVERFLRSRNEDPGAHSILFGATTPIGAIFVRITRHEWTECAKGAVRVERT